MSLLSILGQLPGSTSEGGKLNSTDYMKMARMGIVLALGYAATAVLTALIRDITGGAFGIPPELTTPLAGALSLALEWVRRKVAAPAA